MTERVRVLCVDDDPSVVDLTQSYLERELSAAEVLTAGGAEAALETLADQAVDCVVSDYDMPGRNGLELLRAVRERHAELPFVLFTGKGSEEVASEAVSAGVTDYLQKAGPEKFELLANRIEDAVRQRRAEQSLETTRRKLEELHATALGLREVESCEDAYDLALTAATEVLDFDVCGFFEVEGGVFVPRAADDLGEYFEEVGADEGLVGRARRTGESSLVDDLGENADSVNDDPPFGSCLTVPVGNHGVFQAVAEEAALFDERDRELTELLVAHLAAALDRLGYEGAARATRRKVEKLHGTALELRAVDERTAAFDSAVAAAKEVLDFDVCGVFELVDDEFRPVALENFDPDYERLGRGEGIIGRTFQRGESVLVDDLEEEPDAEPRDEAFRSLLSVPVGDHGVFQAVARDPGGFDERDRELAELLVAHLAGVLDRIAYEADLEATNQRLEAVLENTTANIYIKDLEGCYQLVNEAFADNLGMDREDVVGRTDEALQDDEVAAEVRANDQRAVEERRPIEVEETARWRGEERTYYSVKAPLFDDDGEPWGVCGVSSDVTELKARERELERKTDRLEAFASVVSHDLRNPLSVARGYAELLEEDGHEVAGKAVSSLDRMEEIIDDLLALAREGREVGDTQPVDLADVARTAWGNVATEGAELSVECDLTVEADRSRLAEAFENLFRNSVEHGSTSPQRAEDAVEHGSTSPEQAPDAVEHGSTSPRSQAREDAVEHSSTSPRSQAREDAVEHGSTSTPPQTPSEATEQADPLAVTLEATDEGFAVVDDGVGLPDEDVLSPGVSTNSSGTGVGLAIVDRIAEAHGWELTARNGEEGARFEFAL
jgi:PAS domain S-box-containing protein